MTVPVKGFAPETMVLLPAPLALRASMPEPLIAPEMVRGAVLPPLLLRLRLYVPKLQVPRLTTGELTPFAKLRAVPVPTAELI